MKPNEVYGVVAGQANEYHEYHYIVSFINLIIHTGVHNNSELL